MIIDSHVHIGFTEKSKRGFSFKTYYQLMKDNGIDKSIIMPNVSKEIDDSVLNTQLLDDYKSSKEFQKYFELLILVDPHDKNTLKQMTTERSWIQGIKYHPSITESYLTDKSMKSFIQKCEDYSIPMLIHCGRHERSHISHVIEAAKMYPNVNFVGAHMGGNATDLIEEAIVLLSKETLTNIHLDTSAGKSPWLIELAVSKIGADRIIFGSDEPYADLRIALACIDLADISHSDKEKILNLNSKGIYR